MTKARTKGPPMQEQEQSRARAPRGHLPVPAEKRVEHPKIPVFPTIEEAYRISGRADEFEVDIESDAGAAWYVVRTNPVSEERAGRNIERLCKSTTFSPQFTRWINRRKGPRSKRVKRRAVLMPGYVFVEMPNEEPQFGRIRDCEGVRDFVFEDGQPGQVPASVVAELFLREKEGEFDQTITVKSKGRKLTFAKAWEWIKEGARARVTEGPFEALSGTVVRSDMRTFRAQLAVAIFGRETLVDLEFDQFKRMA